MAAHPGALWLPNGNTANYRRSHIHHTATARSAAASAAPKRTAGGFAVALPAPFVAFVPDAPAGRALLEWAGDAFRSGLRAFGARARASSAFRRAPSAATLRSALRAAAFLAFLAAFEASFSVDRLFRLPVACPFVSDDSRCTCPCMLVKCKPPPNTGATGAPLAVGANSSTGGA